MGSFHQIAFGVACVGGAFWLGHYLNNHPNPDEITRALAEQATPPPPESNFSLLTPGSTVGQLPKYQKPSLPDSVAIGETDLPPPSQLDPALPTKGVAAQEIQAPVEDQEQSDRQKRRVIDVPDFSQLAASFRNTPLELPPLPGTTSPTTLPLNPGTAVPQVLAMRRSAQIDPQSQSKGTEFDERDFAPRLKDRLNEIGSPNQQAQEQASAPVAAVESVLDRSEESAIKDGTAMTEVAEIGVGSPNGVVSLNDRTVLLSRVGNTSDQEPSGIAPSRAMPQSPVGGVANPELQTSDFRRLAKPLVPFGLTDTEKSKLVRLRKPIDRQIKLGTSKFNDYVTQAGDTLPELSTKYYGRPDYYLDIYMANQSQLRNPAEVPAGMTLKIPVYE